MAKAKGSSTVSSSSSGNGGNAGNNAPTGPSNSGKNSSKTGSRAKKANVVDTLRTVVPSIFQESQKTAANHRKNAIMLRKIQEQCAEVSGEAGEEAFNKEFIRNLNVVLAIKKKEPTADRVIQFVSSFILCTREKDLAKVANHDEEADEGISSRFVEYLMLHLLKGVRVKEKQVRLRSCQLIALSINSLGAIDDDLYNQVKDSLMERVSDKEAAVRVQAVFALSKLQGGDDEGELGENAEDSVAQRLVDLMQHDPSAEVRRSALFNIAQTKVTRSAILERARDTDTYNRRGVFTKPMEEISDFKVLSIEERERILRFGLTDRDPGVQKACTKMVATKWIQQSDDNLLEFLEALDVMSSNVADDVLKAFFAYRNDVLGNMQFNVRAYAEYCRSIDDDILFEKAIPEVTRHAFCIQKYSNMMQESGEENRPEAEFIVTQLLMIAKLLDYADENGRRKMYNLLREMLMLDDIPDKHLDCIIESMGKISLNETDFTRIVIEIISDIRTGIDEQEFLRNPEASEEEDDSPDEQTMDLSDLPRKRKRSLIEKSPRRRSVVSVDESDPKLSELDAMLLRIRCLTITKFMLERSSEPLKENSYIYGLLNELVIPALGRNEEVMQELGLHCLGLICLLDQSLAKSNMELFLSCIFASNTSNQLQVLSLKIVFDLILTFGLAAMSLEITEERVINDLLKSLESASPLMQAVAAEGMAKLMLTRMVKNAQILRAMITLYFDPETAGNNHLRQCLSYFLQVYFQSSYDNQVMLSEIFCPTIIQLIEMQQEAKGEMPTPVLMAQQLLEWCEPRRLYGQEQGNEHVDDMKYDYGLQADIAIGLVKAMFTKPANIRRHLPGILHKTRLDADSGDIRLKKLTLLIGNLKAKRPMTESMSKKYLLTVEKNILKMFEDAPESLDDAELAKLVELTEEISFVDEFVAPEDPVETPASTTAVKTRRSRSMSKAKMNDKLAKIMQEVDAMLESSESEAEEAQEEADSDVYDDEDD
ncbi:hypothetical protein BGW38_009060 [Lunasporangiospora selenospora]|uniref:Nuclear condensin complex subunit 3 C-terminal domain-containing protein n=1 Tax=Lunasporangiospora selenospora TaxID=979761 RepID=A0A9P6KII1_9FUNG|nr:hypothetical protein BGW38_009060 [Lunasporangiospora selenospora]